MSLDSAVASLVEAGFNAEDANWALTEAGGSQQAAANLLLDRDQRSQPVRA